MNWLHIPVLEKQHNNRAFYKPTVTEEGDLGPVFLDFQTSNKGYPR